MVELEIKGNSVEHKNLLDAKHVFYIIESIR